METLFWPAAFAIALALVFSFTNGLNDSASLVATVISSRTLSPETALILAAFFDLAGAYFLGSQVAHFITTRIVDPQVIESGKMGVGLLTCALLSAIFWNMLTWRFGFATSSSHALIGGLVGVFLAGIGRDFIQWHNVLLIVFALILSPLLGLVLTFIFTKIILFIGEYLSPKANDVFKRLQVLTLIFQSLSHGSNDAQKSIGLITFVLIVAKFPVPMNFGEPTAPKWVILSCAIAMSVGILIGGWRVIRKLGKDLYRVRTLHSFTSQTTAAGLIYSASHFGFPISTSQVISSAIVGAGAASRIKSVRWKIAADIATAWLVTMPATAGLAALFFFIFRVIVLK